MYGGFQAIESIDRSTPNSEVWQRIKIRLVSELQLQRSRQLIQKCLRLFQIGGTEPPGEPAVK